MSQSKFIRRGTMLAGLLLPGLFAIAAIISKTCSDAVKLSVFSRE
jgi:hypothetical protein